MLANVITGIRIPLSLIMPFVPAFSPVFYCCYLGAGFTDMIDGTIARRLGTESTFGAKLDTAADMIFLVMAAIKLLPEMEITRGLWIGIGFIAFTKAVNLLSGWILYRKFVSVHTIANRIAGFLLFVLPLTMSFVPFRLSAILVCLVTTFAAVQEGHYIRTGRCEE